MMKIGNLYSASKMIFIFDATKHKNCETVSENRVDLLSLQGYCMDIQ
ncbi:hypothetical protein AHZ37_003347 [Salmonella enterica subsp. indica]|uniref:Uncharacterized protein n=2 Tax=Salmonella enterica subsp. indica TaxID=59207 RepID=A0A379XT47_SALER|nr:hypothetical protein [Salmonella enterica subsp. enterica]EDR2772157.1 hypothetical protein [Salmonella enterica subsp. enterica serovar Oslo]EDT9220917.1 hypothetical protein [Salmonella enterica subsp. indica]ESE86349.1 hypothetical protein SEI61121_06261 [Salmonella enterica subsp. indica serovar 6,14,25:z10:1,(2),7 str. 1121]HAE8193383.1 hypothetical protein [Salmonella enterica subsp. indica serovar 41:b:1,7]